jgi:hypothetical protein
MNQKEFCNEIAVELADWKARLYNIISHVETLPALDRGYFNADTNTIRALISEIEEKMKDLKEECRADPGEIAKAA